MYDSNVFYIYALDCNKQFSKKELPKIWFEVEALNGGSHFSHEDSHVILINLLSLCVFITLVGFSVLSYFKESKKEESYINPLGLLVIGCILEFFAIFCKLLDYFAFWYDGEVYLLL